MAFVNAAELADLTGIAESNFTTSLIEFAEAKTKELLGFLEAETKTKQFYLIKKTKMLDLKIDVITTVTNVKYRAAGGEDYTDVETNEYRFISNQGMIILNANIAEDSEVSVSYTLGYTESNIPKIVKMLIMLVTLNNLNLFKPGTVDLNIISKRLGDYSVRYSDSEQLSFPAMIDQLVLLVKTGSSDHSIGVE